MEVYPGKKDQNRQEDRPLTWVPIVFHCTTLDRFEQIVESGRINAPVSLTEIPVGELDRMKIRGREKSQIAIGFPRAYIQHIGFSSVIHTMHMPQINEVLKQHPVCADALKPFIEVEDDLSAFQEIRTTAPLDISEAIWLLTTNRVDQSNPSSDIFIPGRDEFTDKYGKISASYWHRSHQTEVFNEWQFLQVDKHENGETSYWPVGEHYWRAKQFGEVLRDVKMPAGHSFRLRFREAKDTRLTFEGPFRFIDASQRLRTIVSEYYPDAKMPYGLISQPLTS